MIKSIKICNINDALLFIQTKTINYYVRNLHAVRTEPVKSQHINQYTIETGYKIFWKVSHNSHNSSHFHCINLIIN